MLPIDLFQRFVSLVPLAEAEDIQQQSPRVIPIKTLELRKVVDFKVRKLPALREGSVRSIGRMAYIGEEVQRTGPWVSEVSGKSPEKEIGKAVFGLEIEHHMVHPDRGIAIEAIKKPEDILQHKEAGALSVQGP